MTEPEPPNPEDAIDFVVKVGRALHVYGTPVHRLEEWLTTLSQRLGVPGQFFGNPTSLYAAFGPANQQFARFIRAEPGDVDLGRLVDLDVVLNEVFDRKITPEEGSKRVDAILGAKPLHPPQVRVLATGFASGAAAQFFGGGLVEILVATGVGLVLGALIRQMEKARTTALVIEPVAAATGTVLVFAAARLCGGLDTTVATLASLIVLLPGFTLTVAMNELAVRHVVSGTTRFVSAMMSFFTLGFGVAVGTRVGQLFAAPDALPAVPLPPWATAVAAGLAPFCFAILYRARLRDLGAIWGASVLAFYGARFGTHWIEPALGTAVGALVLGLYSNLYARWTHRPGQVPMVPGMMFLVPGSLGFRGVTSWLGGADPLASINTVFQMGFVAISLVVGLLLANMMVRSHKIL